MKVTISVGGIWDAFALAHQLEKRGHLDRIITSYPRFRIRRRGVSDERIVPLWLPEAIYRALRRLPFGLRDRGEYYKAVLFDSLVARRMRPCDILIAYAGFALSSMRRAKAAGGVTVLFRNSSHIEFQQEILAEELARFGLAAEPVNVRIMEKELREYEEADYIRVPSEFARRTFLERGFEPRKILMIPHGIDLEYFVPARKLDPIFRILYVGAISLRKGVPYLLEAVQQLKLKDAELVLIGGISDEIRPILKRYNGLYKYAGIIPRLELPRHYSQGSVYVLPSLEEGMALTVLEAMACGLPVIVSDHTGVESVVRNGCEGFITPIRDVEALKSKLLHLYENRQERHAMGEAARKRTESHTWDWYGELVVQTLRQLLDGREPRGAVGRFVSPTV